MKLLEGGSLIGGVRNIVPVPARCFRWGVGIRHERTKRLRFLVGSHHNNIVDYIRIIKGARLEWHLLKLFWMPIFLDARPGSKAAESVTDKYCGVA